MDEWQLLYFLPVFEGPYSGPAVYSIQAGHLLHGVRARRRTPCVHAPTSRTVFSTQILS